MNKAFVKESDGDSSEDDTAYEDKALKQAGGKNYITPKGLRKLQDEFLHLKQKERPELTQVVSWAAGNGDRSENGDYLYGKKRLREIDKRMRFLAKRIESAEVVDPTSISAAEVRFGATVTILDESGKRKCYSIVGIDEADASKGKISWISPIANALFKKQVGDVVTLRSPKGEQELEIIEIEYKEVTE